MKNNLLFLSKLLFIFTIIFLVLIRIYAFDQAGLKMDHLVHYYTMKNYYETKTLPTMGAYLLDI